MEFKLFDKPDYAAGRPGDAAWYKDRAVSDHINQDGMHRGRLLEVADLIESSIPKTVSVADWGAGNGGLLDELEGRGYGHRFGYDLSPLAVAHATEIYGEAVSLVDVVNGEPRGAGLIIMTEFLEHLVSPHDLLRKAKRDRSNWIVASCPANETPSAFYEFHLWCWNNDSFAMMFERAGWKVLRHYCRADVNTQFVLAERK